jgi:hypothetical protein
MMQVRARGTALTVVLAVLAMLAIPISRAVAADLGIALYGDVDYVVEHRADTTNSFMTPRLEVFYTASQDRLSFLAEPMMEVGEDNEFAIDVERVEVAYIFADWFRLHFGRFHTALGYYNDAYHHGRYFQMTVDRPEIVRFEDEGGLIAAHSVGLHADGRVSLGRVGAIRYDIDLANGRGRTPAEVTNLFDPNKAKAINLRLRFEPAFLEGLILGGNIYLDRISSLVDPAMPTMFVTIDERMLGAHVAYLEHNIHVIAEYLNIVHTTMGTSGMTHAGFGEVGYEIRHVTPYFRYERVAFPEIVDPFFRQNTLAERGSFYSLIAGVGYTLSDYLVLKVEIGQTNPSVGARIQMLGVQCAFAF